MQAPAIKSVYRSASISLRKADVARENGDDDEQLAHLRAFARTVRDVLRAHPLYARRRSDPECAALDAKLPDALERIRSLGGDPGDPVSVPEAAAARLAAEAGGPRPAAGRPPGGGSALLARRSRNASRAASRSGSRAASPERPTEEKAKRGEEAPARPSAEEGSASPAKASKPEEAAAPAHRSAPSGSAERYRARVEGEAARLREEAESVRIAALERKLDTMRARLDAAEGLPASPETTGDRAGIDVSAPAASSSSAGRLSTLEDEVASLRKRIADAADAALRESERAEAKEAKEEQRLVGEAEAEAVGEAEAEAEAPPRPASDPRDPKPLDPGPEPSPRSSSSGAPLEDEGPRSDPDAPGAWIRRGETEMPRPGEPRAPPNPNPNPKPRTPPPDPDPDPPAPAAAPPRASAAAPPSSTGGAELVPPPNEPTPLLNPPWVSPAPAEAGGVIGPPPPLPGKKKSRASPTPGRASVAGSRSAEPDAAARAAADLARAAAEAVAERTRRELRRIAERGEGASRRAELEIETLVAQVLPLHEETAALRAALASAAARIDGLESDRDARRDAASNAASDADAAFRASTADSDAVRAYVERRFESARVDAEARERERWASFREALAARDAAEAERTALLERRVEDERAERLESDAGWASRLESVEAEAEAMRRRTLDAFAAARETAEALEVMRATAETRRGVVEVDAAAFARQMAAVADRLAALEEASGGGPEGGRPEVLGRPEDVLPDASGGGGSSRFAFALPSRLAELEAQVLPTRVGELEDRVAELASAMRSRGVPSDANANATSTSSASAGPPPAPPSPPAGSSPGFPGRSPGAAYSSEIRDLRQRVSRLENVDVGSAEWAHAAEKTARRSLAEVAALRDALGANDRNGDLASRVAATEARVARAEAAANAAVEIASTTSPGTRHAKTLVPALRTRVAEMEVDVDTRLADVERRVGELAEVARETAAAIVEERSPAIGGVAGSPGGGFAGSPGVGSERERERFRFASEDASPAGGGLAPPDVDVEISEASQAKLRELAHEAVTEAVAEAESRVLAKVAEMESRVDAASATRGPGGGGGGTPEGPVEGGGGGSAEATVAALRARMDAMDEAHRASAAAQAEAVAGVVAAAAQAAGSLPPLHARVAELEATRDAMAAAALANAEAADEAAADLKSAAADLRSEVRECSDRVATLEADGEASSSLAVAMAGRVHDLKSAVADLGDARRSAATVAGMLQTSVAKLAKKVDALATEAAETSEALRERQGKAEVWMETAEAEIRAHERRLVALAGSGVGPDAARGFVGELQARSAEAEVSLRELASRVDAVEAVAEGAAPARAARDLADGVAELRRLRSEDVARIAVAEETGAATARRADAAEAHAENAAEASAAATMVAEALRERLVDVEAMLVTSVEATEEEVEANAKAAWEAARALSEEQRAALERATPRERFEKRLDDMDEERKRRARAAVVDRWTAVKRSHSAKSAPSGGEGGREPSPAAAASSAAELAAVAARVAAVEEKLGAASAAEANAETSATNAAAAVAAAAAAAGATETLAEEVNKLRARVAAAANEYETVKKLLSVSGGKSNRPSNQPRSPEKVEKGGAASTRATPVEEALGEDALGSPAHDPSETPERKLPAEDADAPSVDAERSAGALSFAPLSFGEMSAEDAAKAAAEVILPGSLSEGSSNGASSSTDPVESARVAAANARRAVHEEAAKLGISLGSAPGSVDAGGDLRAAAALAGLPGAPDDPTDLAFEADRQLAAELATVCALVEREEARRAALRERVAAEAEAAAAAGDAGAQLAVLEEMRDAQRRWESAMEVQLTRLRGAAHEAEERNAVAAAAARGSARRAASREAREGAVADRLAHLQGRVDAMLRAEGVKYPSAERNAESNAPLPPWGAGPGLNPPGPGGKHQKDENTSSSPRGAARTRAAMAELERGVRALRRATTRRSSETRATVLGSLPSSEENAAGSAHATVVELKSLRAMVRQVQTEMGGLSARVDAVDKRSTGAGRAERDVWKAQLSEVRGDVKSLRRALPAACDEALRRSVRAEKHAAAAHAHCDELGAALAAAKSGLATLDRRVDAVARGADAGIGAAETGVERAKAAARSAKAASRMAEARTVALAGELGRVARHAGCEGVGEALRTGALFRPKPSDEAAPGSAGAGGEENRSRAGGEGAGEEEEEAYIEVAPGGGVVAGMEAEGAIEA